MKNTSVAARLQVLAFIPIQLCLGKFAPVQNSSRVTPVCEAFLSTYSFIVAHSDAILRQDNFDLRNDGVRCSSHLSGTSFPVTKPSRQGAISSRWTMMRICPSVSNFPFMYLALAAL